MTDWASIKEKAALTTQAMRAIEQVDLPESQSFIKQAEHSPIMTNALSMARCYLEIFKMAQCADFKVYF